MNIQMVLPAGVRDLRARLHAAGFQTVIAGGAVRDHLLGLPPHEWDVATAAAPTDVRVLPTLQARPRLAARQRVGQPLKKETPCHLR